MGATVAQQPGMLGDEPCAPPFEIINNGAPAETVSVAVSLQLVVNADCQ